MRLWLEIRHTGSRICLHLNLMSRTLHLSKFEALLDNEIFCHTCSCAAVPMQKMCVFTSDHKRFTVSKANYFIYDGWTFCQKPKLPIYSILSKPDFWWTQNMFNRTKKGLVRLKLCWHLLATNESTPQTPHHIYLAGLMYSTSPPPL